MPTLFVHLWKWNSMLVGRQLSTEAYLLLSKAIPLKLSQESIDWLDFSTQTIQESTLKTESAFSSAINTY